MESPPGLGGFDPGFEIPYANVTSDIIDGEPTVQGGPAQSRTDAPRRDLRVTVPTMGGDASSISTAAWRYAEFAETAEDMQVMLQVLREKLTEPQMIRGTLIEYGDFFSDLDRMARGVLPPGPRRRVLVQGRFPVVPARACPAAEAERRPRRRGRSGLAKGAATTRLRRAGRTAGPDLGGDLRAVEETLLQSLKHAANIRNVGPNSWSSLTVISQSESVARPPGVCQRFLLPPRRRVVRRERGGRR